jgi:hypothetical protein
MEMLFESLNDQFIDGLLQSRQILWAFSLLLREDVFVFLTGLVQVKLINKRAHHFLLKNTLLLKSFKLTPYIIKMHTATMLYNAESLHI